MTVTARRRSLAASCLIHANCFSPISRALVLAFSALFLAASASAGQGVMSARQITTEAGQKLGPTVSPDGAVAYTRLTTRTNPDIYLVREGRSAANLTPDFPGDDSEPSFSPDGQWIAFRSAREGGGIFVMSVSGGATRKVVAVGWNPSWSPDGRQILFGIPSAGASPYGTTAAGNGLFIADAQTGATRRIIEAYAFEPQMSPSGGRVAYWALGGPSTEGFQRDIWTVRADGTEPVRVTNDEAVDWSPIWAPDGRHLYFASDRDGAMKVWRVAIDQVTGQTTGTPELVTQDEGAQIRGDLSIGADGTLTYSDRNDVRSLFRIELDPAGVPAAPARISTGSISPSAMIASPDGEWVLLTRGGSQEDLFVMRSNGTGFLQLTNDVYRDRAPLWSPDGSMIVFRSDRPLGPQGPRSYLWYVINRDGTDLRPFVQSPATAMRWSPDGSHIAMYDNNLMGLVSADGSGPRLVAAGGAVTAPVWSPDGRRLAYRETRGPLSTIFTVDVTDGSAPLAAVRAQGTLGTPVWSPDGQRIAYVLPGEGTFVVDVTQANPTPERLPGSLFNPVAWSAEGRLLLGNRAASAGQAVAPLLYDFGTGTSELVAEGGAAVRLNADGSQILVSGDGGSKLQMIDRSANSVRDLVSVAPPSTFSISLTANGRRLFYVVSEVQADVYRIRVP